MESLVARRRAHARRAPRFQLLLADPDTGLRSLVAARARDAVDALVLEARDGPEAILLGLQRRPQVALLDANMPRLGGIEVALTLRELRPQMRLALHTADPASHRERAREFRLPVFDKLELDRAFGWLERMAESIAEPFAPRTPNLACSSCGYGIACSAPPERCPMCQREGTWIDSPRPREAGVRLFL